MIICFLGPDGAGKSTIINEINKSPLFINTYYFHLKPIKNKKKSFENSVVTDPHKHPPYSKIKSYVKLLYFVCQYNIGWFKNIVPLKNKSTLIIFDRYFDDISVDSRRFRYGGSVTIAKFLRLFIPKPDLYFILTADAKVIYERKQEVSFKELKIQIEMYEKLVDHERYFHVDVNHSPEEITKNIVTIMMEKISAHY